MILRCPWLAVVALAPLYAVSGHAQTSATQPPVGPATQSARVLWLDKQTNVRVFPILQAGTPQTLNGLTVTLDRCAPDTGGVPGRDMAWLTVGEPGRSSDWFAGWMLATMPDVATLDHPRYDLMLLGCGDKPRRKTGPVAKSTKGPVAAPDGVDSESTDSQSAPAGDDPFFIPGVGAPSATEAPPAPEAEAPATPAAPAPSPEDEHAAPVAAPVQPE